MSLFREIMDRDSNLATRYRPMPRRKPAPAASSHLRRAIASAAARLMAEEGIADYGTAKRKAARGLGAGDGDALPTNEEIETELRAWQSLYQEDEQHERVHDLRVAALDVMQTLAEFNPCLTGGALDGTAGRYAAAEIELFADSSKDVEITLLSRDISYDIVDNRKPGLEAQLSIDWNDIPVLLSIYPPLALRQQSKTRRIRADAVLALLQTSIPSPKIDNR